MTSPKFSIGTIVVTHDPEVIEQYQNIELIIDQISMIGSAYRYKVIPTFSRDFQLTSIRLFETQLTSMYVPHPDDLTMIYEAKVIEALDKKNGRMTLPEHPLDLTQKNPVWWLKGLKSLIASGRVDLSIEKLDNCPPYFLLELMAYSPKLPTTASQIAELLE